MTDMITKSKKKVREFFTFSHLHLLSGGIMNTIDIVFIVMNTISRKLGYSVSPHTELYSSLSSTVGHSATFITRKSW